VLIPVRRYEGDIDVSIIPCIGQRLGDDDFDPATSRFHVIGLTQDVIVVMKTQEVDIMVQLLDIDTFRLLHVTSPVDGLQIRLEMICDKLINYAVLRFGITLTNAVVPRP
jgi:hypothetical protein